jgi:SAM-dependent methyltransferase
MTTQASTYRWNTSAAAEAFDKAAEFIHPRYLAVQDQILARLPFAADEPFVLVDLGAGSGRLVERILDGFPNARGVLVDQSEPFLGIAERRLQRFGDRAVLIQSRLQDDWERKLPASPNAIVSMSAIHHMDSGEKQSLYARCYAVLAPGGVFLNGDEFRPEKDADYLALLEWWAAQKEIAEKKGQIPESFRPVFEAWHDRNIRRFGEPKKSGDDCLETITVQAGYLRSIGFTQVDMLWTDKLWGVLAGVKP